MSTLKQQIQADFVTAMKEKNEIAKGALSGLKAKITEAEKAKKVTELSDEDTLKVIIGAIKQRKESAEAFIGGNRQELADKELAEVEVFNKYMPKQLTQDEIKTLVLEMADSFIGESNMMKKKGMLTGAFNKKYAGQFDMGVFKGILDEVIS